MAGSGRFVNEFTKMVRLGRKFRFHRDIIFAIKSIYLFDIQWVILISSNQTPYWKRLSQAKKNPAIAGFNMGSFNNNQEECQISKRGF